MKRYVNILILPLMFGAVIVSCAKDGDIASVRVKTISVCQESSEMSLTRTIMDYSRNMLWTSGDVVRFYCTQSEGGALSGTGGAQTVTDGSESVSITIDGYNPDRDKFITVYCYGESVSSATENSGSSLFFAGGIPATQVGGQVPSCHIAVGTESMKKNSVQLSNIQSYLAFSLSSVEMCGGHHINRIVVEAADGGSLAGDLEVNPKTGEVSLNGPVSDDVTLTMPGGADFEVNTTYYMALAQRTYVGGLKFTYYEDDEVLGILEAGQDITIERGRIFDLSELRAHSEVMGKTIELLPSKAAFTPLMEKRLWVKFTPADVTKVTWRVTEEKDLNGNAVSPGSIIKQPVRSNPDLEYYNNTYCLTVDIEPGGVKGSCKVIATLEGKELSDTCTVHIDDYVDLGLSGGELWCAYNVQGSDTTGVGRLRLCEHIYDYGDYYMWGYLTSQAEDHIWRYGNAYMSRWGGTWQPGGSYGRGSSSSYLPFYPLTGKYYSGDGDDELDRVDDAAYYATGKIARYPTGVEIDRLKGETVFGEVLCEGILGAEFTGRAAGYTDMSIFFPYAGCIDRHGDSKGRGICLQLRSSTLRLDTHSEAPVGLIPDTGIIAQYYQQYNAYADDYRLMLNTTYNDFTRIAAFSIRPVRDSYSE